MKLLTDAPVPIAAPLDYVGEAAVAAGTASWVYGVMQASTGRLTLPRTRPSSLSLRTSRRHG